MRNILPKITLSLLFFVFINNLSAQKIRGFVFGSDNIAISGVSVYFNSEKITETDNEGVFLLPPAFEFPINLRLEHPKFYVENVEMDKNHARFKLTLLSKLENLEEVELVSKKIIDTLVRSAPEFLIPLEKITAEKFDEFNPIDLVSAINETPGVFIHNGAINTNRITIRGVGSRTLYGTNKVRAYFNGIPITDGIGETQIDMFDPENLETLEVIKGPKATQYGSNLGGTLLLNSKKAVVGESFLKSNLTLGSFGMIKNSISTATATEKFSLNLNYDYLKTDGFRENNKYNRKSLLLTANYQFNSKNEVSLLVNYLDYFAQIPSSISKTAFDEDPTQAAFTWREAQGFENNKQILTGLSFTHLFSSKFRNTSSIFYTYLDHYEPRPFNILDEFTNGYGARTVFIKDFLFLKNTANFSFGGEVYKDKYNWKTIENLYKENNSNGSLEGSLLSDNIERRDNLNVFATIEIPFTSKFTGQFGLNFNKTNYRFFDEFNQGENDKSAKRSFDPILAPNLNLLYQFKGNISAYFNFSRGFNYPSMEETLTPGGVINPELGPEKGFNYELGSELFLFNRKLHLQLNAYLLDITDLLVAKRVGDDQYIGRNAGKTEHKGLEMRLSFKQSLNKHLHFGAYLNTEITDHEFIDFVEGEQDYSGNQLTGVPNKKASGGINLGYKNLVMNANFLHIGDIPLNDANALYSEKYTVFNAKVSYKTEILKILSLEINTGINNLTDKKYAASVLINAIGFGNAEPRFYYPGRPRSWFGGVKVKYTF
ncbi:TonB-dependent receptor family protein [Aequorivita marina]|uniref:TonB-dependent receptor family protein n=1 Tax=Aequorivita marina TaxID=3073654 RepID=UPI002876A4D5|nr:TonB-dependent receptor [Aequorivita sp. S2608]MDS1296840.1 TonB-dependent receptor [Aequorivita sp. S2608]